MISRSQGREACRRLLSLLWLPTLAIAAASCDKVPLLAPNGSTITISAAASALPANGTAEIVAFVLEAGGTPPQNGTVVTFTTTLGRIEPAQAKTNGGRAVATFYAGTTSGEATISAASGGAAVASDATVTIKIGAAAVAQVAVNANPGTVGADGGTSTITATVSDPSGNALGGVLVSFSTNAGSLSPAVGTSDANGRAQTTLTTSQQAEVTATAGAGDGSTAAPSGKVTVNINARAAITLTGPVPASPIEDQAVSFSVSRATGGSAIQQSTVTWGDGTAPQTYSGLPTSITHTYLEPGGYGVLLSAIDAYGDVSNGTGSVTVTAKPAPTLSAITYSPTPPAAGVMTFTVTITPATGTSITGTAWTFGDGSPTLSLAGPAGSVAHTYAGGAGAVTVTVTVTASNGETASTSVVLVIP